MMESEFVPVSKEEFIALIDNLEDSFLPNGGKDAIYVNGDTVDALPCEWCDYEDKLPNEFMMTVYTDQMTNDSYPYFHAVAKFHKYHPDEDMEYDFQFVFGEKNLKKMFKVVSYVEADNMDEAAALLSKGKYIVHEIEEVSDED